MNRNHIAALLLISILYFSCSKGKQPGPQNGNAASIKITLVSGSGQTDTIGRFLPSLIVAKVTQNGSPVAGYKVKFQGSGCNSDRIDSILTKTDGTATDGWWLAGDIGLQTMKVYAVNSQNVKVDSATATGTALAGGLGLQTSACSIQSAYVITGFCKLSSGRLFVSYFGLELRYSDDNGASWNLVSSLGKSHKPQFVVSSPTDELFVFSTSDGIFYSTDAGASWTVVSTPAFSNGSLLSVVCTPSGKLIATDATTVHVSVDKGKTWTTPAASFGESKINSPAEDKNGNLYVVGEGTQTIYESADNGASWTAIPHPTEMDVAFYVDNSNTFYKGTITGGIYISKDNGATYTQLVNDPNELFSDMSIQADGNFYYDVLGKGLYELKGANPPRLLDDNGFSVPTTYILAKNNNIVFCSFTGYINYYHL